MAWVYDSKGRIIGTTTLSTAKTPQQEKEENRISQQREAANRNRVASYQASNRQKDYIRSLLSNYTGGGFSSLVTKPQASEVIESLTETY